MSLRKTRDGSMGILTIPAGCRIYRRSTGGKTYQRARKEFDALAMPTRADEEHNRQPAYSIRLGDEFWYVLKADVGG